MTQDRNKEQTVLTIESLLPRALHRDRHMVRSELTGLLNRNRSGAAPPGMQKRLEAMVKRLSHSATVKEKRLNCLPERLSVPDLPIAAERDRIIRFVRDNQVVIVSGETGSGKTTQLPKFCIEAGRGREGRIACTQPRRIAAVSVAERIAWEMGGDVGGSVGYRIRFSDRVGEETVVKMMTDGMLLSETQTDKFLNEYDTIIVDEAHERSLNIDFLLGILRRIVQKRPDIRLIITSATIDTEKFSKAFFDAPVVEVSGRTYPVELRYMPPEGFSENGGEYSYVEHAAAAVDRLIRESPFGDILVFMPTEQDIRETCEILEGRRYMGAVILPLYARLSAPEQARVFRPAGGRKIIVATNVAETSITIPDIKYVVDTGLARISTYVPATRTTALPVSPVSKSSADQRKGRCGRVQNGVCIRLFSEEDYLSRPLYTPPEILRANLAEVILRMIALNLGDVERFEFVDPPPPKQIRDGFNILFELGAIEKPRAKGKKDGKYRLTEKGRMMAKMPLDPRLSRMLLEARENGVLAPVCAIVAALTVADPRQRPEGEENKVAAAQAGFVDPSSDFITLYNIWRELTGKDASGPGRPQVRARHIKQFSSGHYLSFRRLREWIDVYDQVTSILAESGIPVNGDEGSVAEAKSSEKGGGGFSRLYTAIHKSILSGFLANIACKKEKNIYRGAGQREMMIFPGSGVFNRGGQWIVAAEIVETTRRFARSVANIDASWLEPLGRFLCRYTYSDPVWQRSREAVIAKEQVSLYGLIIESNRPVNYGKIDPGEASRVFIREALVRGDLRAWPAFLRHNMELAEQVRDMENRVRRRDLLAAEDDMARFYEDKIGGIYDMRSLRNLMRKKGGDDFLKMAVSDLLHGDPDENEIAQFPDHLAVGDGKFMLTYRFNPGKDDDGVTLTLPVSAARTLPRESTDWVVPGLLEEKIIAMIKALPKTYRKRLVPVSDTVTRIMKEMPKYKGSLAKSLSRYISERFGVDIPVSAWSEDGLPDHLKLRFSLVDQNGKVITGGRDPDILDGLPAQSSGSDHLAAERKKWEKNGLRKWEAGDLPEMIEVTTKTGQVLPAYPALEPDEDSVSLRLYTDRASALQTHKQGVARLFSIYFEKEIRRLKKSVSFSGDIKAALVDFGGKDAVASAVAAAVVSRLFEKDIRKESGFYEHAKNSVNRIVAEGLDLTEKLRVVFAEYRQVKQRIAGFSSSAPHDLLNSVEASLAALMPENFITLYAGERIENLPRYLKALSLRLERGVNDPEKDRAKNEKVEKCLNRLAELVKHLDASASEEKCAAVEEYFWLIEEFKVQLFAQELKTAVRVSEKRLAGRHKEILMM